MVICLFIDSVYRENDEIEKSHFKNRLIRIRTRGMETLKPFFVKKPWGGDFIAQHYALPPEKIGEALILSTLKNQESTVAGQPLSHVLKTELPYMVKIIDADEPLSIQVHPDDNWARELEDSRGKSECWLILKAREGAGVYLGLKPGVTESNLKDAIKNNKAVDELMIFHPVKAGDFISVPSGTIHAIGPGVTILEVQQCSGITYRLWDWGRTDRELHIEKGLKVSNFSATHGILTNIFDQKSPRTLLKHPDFEVTFNKTNEAGWLINLQTLNVQRGIATDAQDFIFVK
jgi:mannose-6-phosphate isomerase